MSTIGKIAFILTLIAAENFCEELFCSKDRKLLLGGVFNYDKVVFAYSWKEVDGAQMMLVWRFEISSRRLVPVGGDTTVDQVFPDIPLFRSGFGLTIKCDKSDRKCKSYRQLVFVFFQTSYKVFRFANDIIFAETNKENIPWGLSPKGEVSNWFSDPSLEDLSAIMFTNEELFLVSKETLFASKVDIKVRLKWRIVLKSKDLTQILGGFVVGSHLLINKNEASDSVLLRYDPKGTLIDKAFERTIISDNLLIV